VQNSLFLKGDSEKNYEENIQNIGATSSDVSLARPIDPRFNKLISNYNLFMHIFEI
jgi:hypothetical protein